MAYSPRNPNGAALAASSSPVAIATDQVQDILVTGAAGQTALGTNLLLTSSGTAAIDTMAYSTGAPTYRSIYVQINGTGTLSSGAVTLEGSNDNVNFIGQLIFSESSHFASGSFGAQGGSSFISAKISYRYLRLRISTVIGGGGSLQAIYRLSTQEYIPRIVAVQGSGASRVDVTTNIGQTGTAYSATTTAATNAASIKASVGNLFELTLSNTSASAAYVKLYNKSSAPTVGTDVPVMTIPVARLSAFVQNFGVIGKRFTSGIAIAVTGGIEATDTTNAPAGVQILATYI